MTMPRVSGTASLSLPSLANIESTQICMDDICFNRRPTSIMILASACFFPPGFLLESVFVCIVVSWYLFLCQVIFNVICLKLFFQHFPSDSGVFRAAGHHLVRVHADRLSPLGIQDTGRGSRSEGSQHFGQQEKGNHPGE